jgi:hypothetical protein
MWSACFPIKIHVGKRLTHYYIILIKRELFYQLVIIMNKSEPLDKEYHININQVGIAHDDPLGETH